MNLETAKKEVEKIYNQETAKLKEDDCYFLHCSLQKLINEKASTTDDIRQRILIAAIFRLLGSAHGVRFLYTNSTFSTKKFETTIKERLIHFYHKENIEYCKLYFQKLFDTTDTNDFKFEKERTLDKENIILNELMKYNCDVGYFYKDSIKA